VPERSGTIARGAASVVSVALAFSVTTISAVNGCYTHQCDPSAYDYDGGRMLDDNTYETNRVDEPWLSYPGNVVVRVHYPDTGRAPTSIDPYVGVSRFPNVPDSNWTQAAGALAEYSSMSPTGFSVTNGTCATYFARFVVHFPPVPGADAGMDGSVDSADGE
jgi:hypothetical protein